MQMKPTTTVQLVLLAHQSLVALLLKLVTMGNLDVIVTKPNARVLMEWKLVVEEGFAVVGTFQFVVLRSAAPLKTLFAAMETNAAQKIK